MNTNATIARIDDPSRNWVFQDPFIRNHVLAQASWLLMRAEARRVGYPEFAGTPEEPDLAREVVVLADGSLWLYADQIERTIIVPGTQGACHKCGDYDRVEAVIHAAYKNVVVEFALCVGCVASHVALAESIAELYGASLAIKEG